ncbi:hypothetical protein CE91St56_09410 [Lachnospiraceae bacterium]|nr:hypothetical protein CE91St56_09410 [Lachnospiraceae bacterium]GKH39881.1 hypothetical protein CE91St57_08550 [Lachnospiraceae bacterium]
MTEISSAPYNENKVTLYGNQSGSRNKETGIENGRDFPGLRKVPFLGKQPAGRSNQPFSGHVSCFRVQPP